MTPARSDPINPGFADPGGPAILIVPGPTKKSLHRSVSKPNENVLSTLGTSAVPTVTASGETVNRLEKYTLLDPGVDSTKWIQILDQSPGNNNYLKDFGKKGQSINNPSPNIHILVNHYRIEDSAFLFKELFKNKKMSQELENLLVEHNKTVRQIFDTLKTDHEELRSVLETATVEIARLHQDLTECQEQAKQQTKIILELQKIIQEKEARVKELENLHKEEKKSRGWLWF